MTGTSRCSIAPARGRRHRPCPPPQRGLILIELILVITIMGLAMSAVLVTWSIADSKHDLKEAARQIARLYDLARAKSASEQVPVLLRYDLSTSTIALGRVAPSEALSMAEFTLPGRVELTSVSWGRTEIIVEGVAELKVTPPGIVHTHTACIRDRRNNVLTLLIDGTSGTVSFYENFHSYADLVEENLEKT